MNKKCHSLIVRRDIIMKCAMRFCDRKNRSLRKETRGSYVPYSIKIDPIDGKCADNICSPDDIASVTVYRVRPVPMTTEFRTATPGVDEPHHDNDVPELNGSRIVDMYEYYLKAAFDNSIVDIIEIS